MDGRTQMLKSLAVGLALGAALATSPAMAQGDVKTGETVARTWCSPCHNTNGRGASDVVPSFGYLAAERSERELRAFLTNPHGAMPNIQLSRQQIEDVISYMETLK